MPSEEFKSKYSIAQIEEMLDKVHDESIDYGNILNKPSVNGVELTSNKTPEDLGLVSLEQYNDQVGSITDITVINTQVDIPDLNDPKWIIVENKGYSKIYLNVDEITDLDNPVIDILPKLDSYEDELDQWNKVIKAKTQDKYIILYTTDPFEVPVTMAIKIIRDNTVTLLLSPVKVLNTEDNITSQTSNIGNIFNTNTDTTTALTGSDTELLAFTQDTNNAPVYTGATLSRKAVIYNVQFKMLYTGNYNKTGLTILLQGQNEQGNWDTLGVLDDFSNLTNANTFVDFKIDSTNTTNFYKAIRLYTSSILHQSASDILYLNNLNIYGKIQLNENQMILGEIQELTNQSYEYSNYISDGSGNYTIEAKNHQWVPLADSHPCWVKINLNDSYIITSINIGLDKNDGNTHSASYDIKGYIAETGTWKTIKTFSYPEETTNNIQIDSQEKFSKIQIYTDTAMHIHYYNDCHSIRSIKIYGRTATIIEE